MKIFLKLKNIEEMDSRMEELREAIDKINKKLQNSSSDLKVA